MSDCNGAGQWGKAWRAAKASAFFGLLNCPNLSAEKRSKNQSATQLIHLNLTKSEKIPGNDLRDFEILRMSTEASATQSTRSTDHRDGRDSLPVGQPVGVRRRKVAQRRRGVGGGWSLLSSASKSPGPTATLAALLATRVSFG